MRYVRRPRAGYRDDHGRAWSDQSRLVLLGRHAYLPELPAPGSRSVTVGAARADRRAVSGSYASPGELAAWAQSVIDSRAPDFVIGNDYLRRWWIVPRNESANVYLHYMLHSDDDRALHDHPWPNISVLIAGRYFEHLPDGSVVERKAGDVVTREATDAHRLELVDGETAISLFLTGPKVREWGFHCPNGWKVWTEFVDMTNTGQVGPGCGD